MLVADGLAVRPTGKDPSLPDVQQRSAGPDCRPLSGALGRTTSVPLTPAHFRAVLKGEVPMTYLELIITIKACTKFARSLARLVRAIRQP